jgi:hypothetical protein
MIKVAVRREGSTREVVSPARNLIWGSKLEIGDPVTVILLEDAERPLIVELSRRADGCPFDCLQEVTGIIDHQNREKLLASIYITETQFCLLRYEENPRVATWVPGTAVRIWCTVSDDRIRAYRAELGDVTDGALIRSVRGAIRIHAKGFGFVDDVFVPPDIAQRYADGQDVALIAVWKLNKKRNQMGWAVVGSLHARDAMIA